MAEGEDLRGKGCGTEVQGKAEDLDAPVAAWCHCSTQAPDSQHVCSHSGLRRATCTTCLPGTGPGRDSEKQLWPAGLVDACKTA